MTRDVSSTTAWLVLIVLASTVMSADVILGATFEMNLPLEPLAGESQWVTVPIDLGGQVRILQPFRILAEVSAAWSMYHCNACASDFYVPPPCQWDYLVSSMISVEIRSAGQSVVHANWLQDSSGEISLDLTSTFSPSPQAMELQMPVEFVVYYGWYWEDAYWGCQGSRGSGGPTSTGSLVFRNGLTLQMEYDAIVPNEGMTWGRVKAMYR